MEDKVGNGTDTTRVMSTVYNRYYYNAQAHLLIKFSLFKYNTYMYNVLCKMVKSIHYCISLPL